MIHGAKSKARRWIERALKEGHTLPESIVGYMAEHNIPISQVKTRFDKGIIDQLTKLLKPEYEKVSEFNKKRKRNRESVHNHQN